MSDAVSRETPPPPDWAAGVFSDRLPVARAYAALLAEAGVVRGLIGPREVPRLWERHLGNCAVLGELVPESSGDGADVCDLGSGAGLPGLVLAIARPDLRLTLVEPLLRRASFLEEAVTTLDLANVTVLRARAEELHGDAEFSVVTSRALAPLPRLLAWSMPLVRRGGALLAMKGASVEAEVAAARGELSRYGAGTVTVHTLAADLLDRPTTVLEVEATRPSALVSGTARPRPGGRSSKRSSGQGRSGSRRRRGRPA